VPTERDPERDHAPLRSREAALELAARLFGHGWTSATVAGALGPRGVVLRYLDRIGIPQDLGKICCFHALIVP
jgi:hypothetical protein